MAKPWNHPPGKLYRPHLPEKEVEKRLKARKEFGDKWDNIFGKKKLNNMEDNNGEEQDGGNTKEAGKA